jgi:RNA polymerase sigma factor (sigma-70 family)
VPGDTDGIGEKYRSDPALVEACLAGHEWAWDELVERYGRLVFSVARRTGLTTEDAEDVVQDVFTIALRRLHGLRDQTRLSSWLITTTYRECWRLGRRAGAPPVPLDAEVVDGGAPPVEEVVRWEREQLVHEALGRIDGRCRALLTALFLDDGEPSYQEIAGRLDMPVGSIGPTRARCFRKLETALVELGATAGV